MDDEDDDGTYGGDDGPLLTGAGFSSPPGKSDGGAMAGARLGQICRSPPDRAQPALRAAAQGSEYGVSQMEPMWTTALQGQLNELDPRVRFSDVRTRERPSALHPPLYPLRPICC